MAIVERFKEPSMYGLSAKLAFVERWPLVEVFLFFFQDETITKVSIVEEDAKLWLLPLSFRLQEFADCLVRAHSRLLDLLDIYR